MLRISIFGSIIFFSTASLAAEDVPGESFLLWLGQTAELEEIGMDVDELIDEQKRAESQEEENQSQ